MSSFDSDNLFDSGPCRFSIGGRSLQHDRHASPHGQGEHIIGQGRSARAIEQHGQLLSDTAEQMTALCESIEAKLDGLGHDLVDDRSRTWTNTVMLAFEPQPLIRIGKRYRRAYRIKYLQTLP